MTTTVSEPRLAAVQSVAPEATTVRQVSLIYTEFLKELHCAVPKGIMRPLVNDEDASGADFVFAIEVKQADFERVLELSSELEAKYYAVHGVNFIIVPEVV